MAGKLAGTKSRLQFETVNE